MALNYQFDATNDYKSNIYSITLDMSGWEKTTINVVAPIAAPITVYGSNNGGAAQGITDGNAELAIGFTAIQATNIATATAGTTISTAGNYTVPINARFLRLQGGGANVYKIVFNHWKS